MALKTSSFFVLDDVCMRTEFWYSSVVVIRENVLQS
jgi:hypothetical protein